MQQVKYAVCENQGFAGRAQTFAHSEQFTWAQNLLFHPITNNLPRRVRKKERGRAHLPDLELINLELSIFDWQAFQDCL
jgi:hypothetical protein